MTKLWSLDEIQAREVPVPDNPSKLQHIQLPTEPSYGLGSGVVKTDCGNGGAIDGSPSPSAAKENIERLPCDCEYPDAERKWHFIPGVGLVVTCQRLENCECSRRKGDLP